jgi:hypothetical protein
MTGPINWTPHTTSLFFFVQALVPKFYFTVCVRTVVIFTYFLIRGKRFTVCTEIVIILGMVRFTIRGGRLRYKRYDAHFLKKK